MRSRNDVIPRRMPMRFWTLRLPGSDGFDERIKRMENWQGKDSVGGGHSLFQRIISLENLFEAWKEFRRGKAKKKDVQAFEWNLEENIFTLHEELKHQTYQHGGYQTFYVCDPKRRLISKPSVRDRLLHHAIVRMIEPILDRAFIYDVWSCRKGKGTHRAIERFQRFGWKLSRNNTRPVWVLKLDIRKFFQNVDQDILLADLSRAFPEQEMTHLFTAVVRSFLNGIPLGNLTSQLFANVYLNALDQFIKNGLRIKYYVRYCDDFVLLHHDRVVLEKALPRIQSLLFSRLRISLHPEKTTLTKYHQGVDFLGFVCFPHYRILRAKTWKWAMRRVNQRNIASYFGLLQHGRSHERTQRLATIINDALPRTNKGINWMK